MRCFNCEECRNHQFSQMLVCFIFQKSLEESSCFMKTANCEHFLQLQEKSLNLGVNHQRLFQNSESFERATRDVHGEKLQVFILERLVVFSPKADF